MSDGVLEGVEDLLPGEEVDQLRRVHLGELGHDAHRISAVPGGNLFSEALELLLVVLPLGHPPGRGAAGFLEAPVADEGVVQDVEGVAGYKHLVGLKLGQFFCSTSLPLALVLDGFNQHFQATVQFPRLINLSNNFLKFGQS